MIKALQKIILSALLTLAVISPAWAQDWTVSKISGEVKVSQNAAAWVDLKSGARLVSYSWINTGKRGRVHLRRGTEALWIKPNSLVGLFDNLPGHTQTTIRAQFGTLRADVQTKNQPHFTVETPLLAAVVKGTMFDVTAHKTNSSIKVLRGVVNVTDLNRGLTVDITKGQSAQTGTADNQTLTLAGPGARNADIRQTTSPARSVFAKQNNSTSGNSANSSSSNSNSGNGNSGNSNSGNSNSGNGNSGNSNSSNGNSGNGNSGNSNSSNGNSSNSNSGNGNSGNGNSGNGNSGNGNSGNGNSGNGNGNGRSN